MTVTKENQGWGLGVLSLHGFSHQFRIKKVYKGFSCSKEVLFKSDWPLEML